MDIDEYLRALRRASDDKRTSIYLKHNGVISGVINRINKEAYKRFRRIYLFDPKEKSLCIRTDGLCIVFDSFEEKRY